MEKEAIFQLTARNPGKKPKKNDKESTERVGRAYNREVSCWTRRKQAIRDIDGIWCVDSGATSHMTNDQKFFDEYTTIKSSIEVADGKKAAVLGKGTGVIQCRLRSDEIQFLLLKDVLYVPSLIENLLSFP